MWHKMDVMGNDDKQAPIGVIGGSGFYLLDNLTDAQWVEVDTPFGKPSDAVCGGSWTGVNWRLFRGTVVVTVYCLRTLITARISMPLSRWA